MTAEQTRRTPESGVSWNPETRQLTQTERIELSPNLEIVDIEMTSGEVRIEQQDGDRAPQVIVETRIAADSESDARRQLKKLAQQTRIKASDRSVRIEALGQQISEFGNDAVVTNSIVGGSVHIGGQVIINGRQIPQNFPTNTFARREITVVLPKDRETTLNISSQAGNTKIDKIRGNANIAIQSGNVQVKECVGNLEAKLTNGDVSIDKIEGKLTGQVTSGDLRVRQLRGTLNLTTTSGNITIHEAVLSGGGNRVSVILGDVHVGIGNRSLRLSAKTTSGDMDVDRREFTPMRQNARAWGETIDGYYGTADLAPQLSINATSGDIVVEHTGREIEPAPTTQVGNEYADCSYCGSAYPSKQIEVKNGRIKMIHDAACAHCSAAEPIVHKDN